MRARLHGGPHDGKTVAVAAAFDELVMLDPAKVTIDSFHPIDGATTRYKFRRFREGSRGRLADYSFLE